MDQNQNQQSDEGLSFEQAIDRCILSWISTPEIDKALAALGGDK